jgi:hypothetical protein
MPGEDWHDELKRKKKEREMSNSVASKWRESRIRREPDLWKGI